MGDLFLSAGPCSAETEAQVMATAKELADSGISFFRSGLWKPRTRPGSFEGVGIVGLDWLQAARKETGLSIGIEVANPDHVAACLEANVDVVWIGARTTPNPFAVQAIADALKGNDVPVFVKNPVSPDLELWIGAIERLAQAGVTRIGAIHRGFTSSRKLMYRNAPGWRLPIELKRRLPDIPLLCDPSHICGRTDLIYSIAQEALDLLYDGLMIEVHVDPARALSDAKQQLTPVQFLALLDRLTLKSERSDDEDFRTRLRELRAEVDAVDQNFIDLLGKRMDIVRRMGDLKRDREVSTLQPQRWQEILASRMASGKEAGLEEAFLFQVFEAIHEEAIRQQENQLKDLLPEPGLPSNSVGEADDPS